MDARILQETATEKEEWERHLAGESETKDEYYPYSPHTTGRAFYFNCNGAGVRPLPRYKGFSASSGPQRVCAKNYSTSSRGLHGGIFDIQVSGRYCGRCLRAPYMW